jgi:hypothetical protein
MGEVGHMTMQVGIIPIEAFQPTPRSPVHYSVVLCMTPGPGRSIGFILTSPGIGVTVVQYVTLHKLSAAGHSRSVRQAMVVPRAAMGN